MIFDFARPSRFKSLSGRLSSCQTGRPAARRAGSFANEDSNR